MNLRKMSKTALIAEIRRLRKIEIQRNQMRDEIYRRDEATKNWNLITPIACITAHLLAKAETWKQEQEIWEQYWSFMSEKIDNKRINQFWAERCADLADEYRRDIYTYKDIFNK